jgi:hexosaminidase
MTGALSALQQLVKVSITRATNLNLNRAMIPTFSQRPSSQLPLIVVISICVFGHVSSAETRPLPTELFLRGYSVIPTPKKVVLESDDFDFDASWIYDAVRIAAQHIAVRSLLRDLSEFHALDLKPADAQSRNIIRLAVEGDAVLTGDDPEIHKQAYRLKLTPGLIEITGNSDQGLFYGVQTFLQLLKPGPWGAITLPIGTIEDWPRFQLRFLHWNTNEHQDRMETLKRYLDWSARFKANMIGFDLEDKFEYPSNPVIGAPGAFTTAQMQELVDYGLERFIQIVPEPQAPAHISYVLKHPEFAHLRADGNNYQACLCDEEAYKLIFQMYDDLIKATKGVDYFFVSTDEVYYAGICAKCRRPFNPENKSLTWVEFVQRAAEFLHKRDRKMLFWLSTWVLPEHIRLLPRDLINAWGIDGDDRKKIDLEKERGIKRLGYGSMEGLELLFPDYLPLTDSGELTTGRLEEAFRAIPSQARAETMIGVFGAAWDASGVHNETFWLGWAAMAQYGWAPGTPSVDQTVADFMRIYYGPRVTGMAEVYRGLQAQARFFEQSWDRVVSRVRGPGYGSSFGKGTGTTRFDRTLPAPALPSLPTLHFTPVYVGRYAALVDKARRMAFENDILSHRIEENILKADRNRYNLEVLLALAELTEHHDRMLLGMGRIEAKLEAAYKASETSDAREALSQLVAAYSQGRSIVEERASTLKHLKSVWEKSQFPKGRSVGGKKYVHILDDTKDYFADRRVDLSYMTAPEESMGLEEWTRKLWSIIEEYAKRNKLPVSSPSEQDQED